VTSTSPSDTPLAGTRLLAALQQLAAAHGKFAEVLAGLMAVVAEEALQNAGFAARLNEALIVNGGHRKTVAPPEARISTIARTSTSVSATGRPKRGRRAPGPWDPFSVYAEVGEAGLRERLSGLELDQLRNIIAEHGFNNDGLAMRWTKADRVVGRIVDRVVDKAAKGDAFRGV
jgi:hypothetical protein